MKANTCNCAKIIFILIFMRLQIFSKFCKLCLSFTKVLLLFFSETLMSQRSVGL